MKRVTLTGLVGSAAVVCMSGSALAQDKTVVTVWDQFFSDAPNALMDSFVAEFEAAHPGVNIERNVLDTDAIRATLPTALASGSGPDLFYYDAGPAFLGPLVDAGLVADLSDEYETLGWDELLVDWAVERVTFNDRIWGVPNEIEYTNVYFNKNLLDDLGLGNLIVSAAGNENLLTLNSMDDFATILTAAKDSGLVPVSFGNRDPGRGGHLFSYFLTLTAGKDFVDNILFGDGTWDAPEVVAAWELYKQYNDEGFYTPSANAISYDEGNALFFNNRAGTNITGTWLVADVMDQVADPESIDFLLLPSVNDDLPLSAAAGIGSTFAISESSDNKDIALEFLDFIMSKEAGQRWLEDASIVPPIADLNSQDFDLSPMMQRVVMGASLPLSYNLDVVMPSEWNDAMKSGTQSLLDGSSTAQDVAKAQQTAWETAKSEGRIWKAK
ncbi:ABC transporter substrate-binding protein [Ruegeria hyattellae]|uniref:ABC transporter substrate-binding protein n=1 Tax=Ruegeria hyattellae TaxID=3233337 RepID=UPI00355B7BA0